MFIYDITETDKIFRFKGVLYKTPCKVEIVNLPQNNDLRNLLKKLGLKKYKVTKTKTTRAPRRTLELGGGDGTITLSAKI